MDELYLLAAARYVELNPVRAQLVTSPGDIYQPPKRAPLSACDLDVAKSVVKWQVDNGRVPDELNQLVATIRNKI